MAQITVIGRITSDVELKYSQKKKPYVRFNLAENIGSKDRARTQYYQVWAWGENALKLSEAPAKKGFLIAVSGKVELETYTKQDGISVDKRLKVALNDWNFISVGNRGDKEKLPQAVSSKVTTEIEAVVIDGDREALPG